MTIHILRTPMHEHRREPDQERYCFQCRKRLIHEAVLMVCDDPYSYYGPSWHLECAGCGEDHSVFGGYPRVFEEAL